MKLSNLQNIEWLVKRWQIYKLSFKTIMKEQKVKCQPEIIPRANLSLKSVEENLKDEIMRTQESN